MSEKRKLNSHSHWAGRASQEQQSIKTDHIISIWSPLSLVTCQAGAAEVITMAVDVVVVAVMAQEEVVAEAAHIRVKMPPTTKAYAVLLLGNNVFDYGLRGRVDT